MKIPIYGPGTRRVKMTYNGKYYQIDDGSDYLLMQIHKILNKRS